MGTCAYHQLKWCEDTECTTSGCKAQPKSVNGVSWWTTGAWRATAQNKTPPPRKETLILRYNPTCKHDHTSYDISTCEECRQYSIRQSSPE